MDTELLSPDAQATRKAHINSDIIKACTIKPICMKPTARGIGLYTHVAGPKTARQNPHFDYADNADGEVALLPLGGPKKAGSDQYTTREPHKDVAAVYRELQDAVIAEEKIWSDMRAAAEDRGEKAKDAYIMTFQTLKKKYGDIGTPAPEIARPTDAQQGKRRHSEVSSVANDEAPKRRKVSFAPQTELRRQSTGTSIGGSETDAERRGSAGGKVGNIYEAYRDPRRRGR